MIRLSCVLISVASILTSAALAQPPAPPRRPPVPPRPAERAAPDRGPDELMARIEEFARTPLGQEARPRVAAALTQALDAPRPEIQWHAARAISRLGISTPETAGKLQKLAGSSDAAVRVHSVRALGSIGDKSPETVAVLMKAAGSSDATLARAAIVAIQQLQLPPEQAVKAFAGVMQNDQSAVATYAVEAAVAAGAKATPMLIEALKSDNSAYWAALAISEIGPDAAGTLPGLIEALERTDDAALDAKLCLAIAKLGPSANSASDAVCDALANTEDPTLRMTASYALGAIGAKDCSAALETCANCDDDFVAMIATWAQAKTSPSTESTTAAVEKLTAALTSDNAMMREAAAKGLLELGADPEIVAPRLMAAANGASEADRANLVAALASLGDKIVPRAVNGLAKPESQQLALEVIEKLGPSAAPAVPAIVEQLSSADDKTKARMHVALAKIGPASAGAAEQLVAALDSENQDVRHSALFALRNIGSSGKSVAAKLAAKMESADPDFDRFAIAWVLARTAADEPAIAAQIVPVLQQGLVSKSEVVRVESLVAASDLGAAAAPLRETITKLATDDASQTVRDFASTWLQSETPQ